MEISENFNHNRDFFLSRNFPENLTKFEIFLIIRPKLRCFENLDQNWDSLKFDKNEDFRLRLSKIEILNRFDQNLDSSKIFKEIVIFRKFCTKSRLSEIWTEYEIIKNFDQNRDDFRTFWQKSRFSKMVAKIKIFRQILTNVEIWKILAEPKLWPE